MKYLPKLFVLLFITLVACTADDESNSKNPIVVIDNINLLDLANVNISGSFKNVDEVDITQLGFCWSKTPNPTINDNKLEVLEMDSFSAIIDRLPLNSELYFRAFLKSNNRLIYSDEKKIKTKDLQIVWEKEYNTGKHPAIKKVIPLENNSSLLLTTNYQVYGDVAAWTGLMKIDDSGNVLWEKEYNIGEWKTPVSINLVNGNFYIITEDHYNGWAISILKIGTDGEKLHEVNFKRKENQRFLQFLATGNNNIIFSTLSYDSYDGSVRIDSEINKFTLSESLDIIHEEKVSLSNENDLMKQPYIVQSLSFPDKSWLSINNVVNKRNGNIYHHDVLLQKYNSDNILSWQKTYSEPNDEYPIDILPINTNRVAVLIQTGSKGITNKSGWILEIDSNNGEIINDFTYSNLHFETSSVVQPNHFKNNSENQYYIVGAVGTTTFTGANAFISKVDNGGKVLWEHTFLNEDLVRYSSFNSVIINESKEILVFGTKLNSLSDESVTIIIKKIREN